MAGGRETPSSKFSGSSGCSEEGHGVTVPRMSTLVKESKNKDLISFLCRSDWESSWKREGRSEKKDRKRDEPR